MDIDSLRAALPGMTRAVFGDMISLQPMREGKMSQAVDADRPAMVVRARFDLSPDVEQMGGGRERGGAAHASSEIASVSIERVLLPFDLRQGDRVSRIDKVSGKSETYRIARFGRAGDYLVLAFLSGI